jgi:hypothetical protein
MKTLHFIPLLFLTACSTAPKLTLTLLPPPQVTADNSGVRYPEIVRAYHVGRYADPNDDLVMHEQHVLYRVEENTRWDLRPGSRGVDFTAPRNPAFSPGPVNEAILAEVNSQRLATAQIMAQARLLSSAMTQVQNALQEANTNLQQTVALRTVMSDLKQRIVALENAQKEPSPPSVSPVSTTNNYEKTDPMSP